MSELDISRFMSGTLEDSSYGSNDCPNCVYVVCLKSSVNGTRKLTKQKIQTNEIYWPSK
jgi:hypothetical protein